MSRAYDRAPNPRPSGPQQGRRGAAAALAETRIERRCLSCQATFQAPSRFIRCCDECRRSAAFRGYDLDA